MPKIKIIKAGNSDGVEITALTIRSKSYWDYTENQIEEWREDLTITAQYIDQNQVFKLIDNDQLVGFYAFQPQSQSEVKMNFLFIDPVFIGQGYGRILMADLIERVKNLGFQCIVLDADPYAEQFYQKFDFKVIGQLKSTIKDRFLPIMKKELNCTSNT